MANRNKASVRSARKQPSEEEERWKLLDQHDKDAKTSLDALSERITETTAKESVSKELLLRRLGRNPSPKWMFSNGFNDSRFDFEKLLRQGPPVVKACRREQLTLGNGA